MPTSELQITYVPIDHLKAAIYNPRKWTSKALADLKVSIQKFRVVDPIIANGAPERLNIVIGGHMRLQAAKELGYKEIPVVYVFLPDIEQEQELNLRLNANAGEWDFEKLKSFDLDLLLDVGFSSDELANVWIDTFEAEDDDFDEVKELEAIKKPQTRPGDLIALGEHRLLCGDSTDPAVLTSLLGKERASMLYSDPPYNIQLDYSHGFSGKQRYGADVVDNRSYDEYRDFLAKTLSAALAVTKNDAHIFYWCDQIYIGLLQELYRAHGIQNKRVCLWIKNAQNPTPGVAFSKAYEPCVYGVRGKPYIAKQIQNLNEVMNKELGTGNGLLDDISDIWLAKRLPGKAYEHATSKPPNLHEKAIRRCARPGEIILDSFAGSASTLIAAEQLKRRAYLVEQQPVFCDLAIKRFKKLTGQDASVIRNMYEKG